MTNQNFPGNLLVAMSIAAEHNRSSSDLTDSAAAPPAPYVVPGWIWFFSVVYLSFLLAPLPLITFAIWRQDLKAEAFGFILSPQKDFLPYLGLLLLQFLGGWAALGILRKRRWGLTLGLIYSIAAIGLCCLSLLLRSFSIPLPDSISQRSLVFVLILLGFFLRWLLQTRRAIQSAGQTASPQ